MRDNIKVNIREWVFDILELWRVGALLVIVMAVLMGAFSYYKSDRKIKNEIVEMEKSNSGDNEEKDYFELLKKIGLDDEKTERAEKAAVAIYEYEIAYVTQKEYMDNSIWLSLDSASVPTVELKYYVDNHYQAEYPIMDKKDNSSAIVNGLMDSVCNEDLYKKIAEKLGDKDYRYYDELIRFDTNDALTETGAFSMMVVNSSKERVMEMAEIIKDGLNEKAKEMQAKMGEFDLVLSSDTYREAVYIALLNDQRNGANSITIIRDNIYNLIDKLDDDVAQYALLKVEELQSANPLFEEEEAATAVSELTQKEVAEENPQVSKKYVLLGAFLGILLLVVYVVCRNLFNTKLYSENELIANFDIPLLGVINLKNKRRSLFSFVDNYIWKLRNGAQKELDGNEALQITAAKINLFAEKRGVSKIAILSSIDSERCAEYEDQISNSLKTGTVRISYYGNILYNMNTLNRLTQIDGVVLIEEEKKSAYVEITNEIEVCNLNNIPIIGIIVIKE